MAIGAASMAKRQAIVTHLTALQEIVTGTRESMRSMGPGGLPQRKSRNRYATETVTQIGRDDFFCSWFSHVALGCTYANVSVDLCRGGGVPWKSRLSPKGS